MDKNKSRTDLLAAGRKKLQQFRQKKDGKGSGSHGKSTKKSGKSEQHEADAHAVSTAAEPTALSEVPEGETAVRVDSDSAVVDSSFPHSTGNSMVTEIDHAVVDPSTVLITQESNESHLAHNPDLTTVKMGDSEHEVDLVQNEEKKTGIIDTEVAGIVPFVNSESMTSGGKTTDANMSASVDLLALHASVDSTEGVGVASTVEPQSVNGEDLLLHSEKDFPETSLIKAREDQVTDVGTMQEADGLDGEQSDHSREVEFRGDSKLTYEIGKDAETLPAIASLDTCMEVSREVERSVKVDEVSVSSGANMADEDSVSALALPDPEISSVSLALENQHSMAAQPGSFNEEMPEVSSGSGDFGEGRKDEVQDHTGKRAVAEGHNGQHVLERSLEINSVSSARGWTMPSVSNLSLISLSQLTDLIKGLSEEEYRFLLKSREPVSNVELGTSNSIVMNFDFPDMLERLKEELFLTNFTKDIFQVQLAQQSENQVEFDHQHRRLVDEMSLLSASLDEVREKNQSLTKELADCRYELQAVSSERMELENQLHTAKTEVGDLSARVCELQNNLDRSLGDLLSQLSELADFKNLVSTLQAEKENLNETIISVTEEKRRCLEENEKLSTDLADCRSVIEALHVESSNLTGSVSSVTKEIKKLEGEKEHLYCENDRLLIELAECKDIVSALQIENANLKGSLALVTEERVKLEDDKKYFALENERLSSELLVLQEQLSIEHEERMRVEVDLKEVKMRLEQIMEENISLTSSLEMYKARMLEANNNSIEMTTQVGEFDDQVEISEVRSGGEENATAGEGSQKIVEKGGEVSFSLLKKPLSDSFAGHLLLGQEVYNDSFGFVTLKMHLEEAEKVLNHLEKAIEGAHYHSASFSRAGGKVPAPGVSKLIQAFESKVHFDEQEAEDRALTESKSLEADPFMLMKEQIGSLRALFEQLVLDAANASVMFKAEQYSRENTNVTFRGLKDQYEVLGEHSNNLEATNIELEVLYEAVKQHGSNIEASNSELVVLCEAVKQEITTLKAENSELVNKLHAYESRISELQSQFCDVQNSSNEVASEVSNQLEVLQKEVDERVLILEQNWKSTFFQIVEIIRKLDESVGNFGLTVSGSHDSLDIITLFDTSVNAATKVIEDIWKKLEASRTDHEAICSLYRELNENCDDLHRKNELGFGILHKMHGDLRKLLTRLHRSAGENETGIENEKHLDPLDCSIYETSMVQLEDFLSERLELESDNERLKSELKKIIGELDELDKRCLDSNAICKLTEDIEGVLKLEDTEIDLDTSPASRFESLVYILVKKYKTAGMQVSLSRDEFESKGMKLAELQEEIQALIALCLQHENEVLVLKEGLNQTNKALYAARSDLQVKASELEQSEQRYLSTREKLSIAVAKGKGLVVQRDGLKQSLAETSSELESCLQELHFKDAKLHEAETKLKAYSEAGERVEALESELSYIRNSATALRESFLLKDSVLQRIEEVLEDLDLPEHFHSRDIIEKIDWLARSATGNPLPLTEWDQKSSAGGGSNSDAGFVGMETWKDDVQPSSNTGEDLKRKYEELQSKFYGLAEQNEMLEQSLMERNKMVQRWEELLNRIEMPSNLRSVEPEDRIEWLGSALSEAHRDTISLQQKVANFENYCGSLSSDLEDSWRRMSDLEADLQAVIQKKEHLSERLEILNHEHENLSSKTSRYEVENRMLQDEVSRLQENVAELCVNERRAAEFEVENKVLQDEITRLQENVAEMLENEKHSEGEIRRLQSLVCDALQVPGTQDQVSGASSTECLEVLLRRLLENYANFSSGKNVLGDAVGLHSDVTHNQARSIGALQSGESDIAVLKKELEEALHELIFVKEERDGNVEKQQNMACEIETLEKKRDELQLLLNQEEQKSASLREKLNVAVRKGKSLVQQRDSLKQTIEEMNAEMERLKSENNIRETKLSEYEQKFMDLSMYPERVEALESELLLFRNRLAETERYLQEQGNTLSMILSTISDIDVGDGVSIGEPIKKLEQIAKVCVDLRSDMASSEQESKKSRRAAELLLAELNEVQERNDGLQEELLKTSTELAELTKERDLAEAAKLESLSRLEELYNVQAVEQENQFSELVELKSGIDQLRMGFNEINNLLTYVFSKDFEVLHNLEAGMESCLKPSNAAYVPHFNISGGRISGNSDKKENFPSKVLSLNSIKHGHFDGNFISEICSSVGHQLQELMIEVGQLKEKLHNHSSSLQEQAINLFELVAVVHKEIASLNESYEVVKRDIVRVESTKKEKDKELVVLRKNISILVEAFSSSVMELESRKAELLEYNLAAGDLGINMKSANLSGGSFDRQDHIFSEESITAMADKLLLAVRDVGNMKLEIMEGGKKEMRITITELQKELQEKEAQKERICMDLVNQIKEAKAAATRYSQDLQSSRNQVHDLEIQVEVIGSERNLLDQRVNELQNAHATSTELQERIRSLTDVLASKDQEIEALMQALDEEEVQMEDLNNKVRELEKVVQQKNLDLENLEASRGKAMKKLSITVSKFDELHHLSASLLTEVEKLQSQLQDRDAEISFLRQEVTRCTNDVLVASQSRNKKTSDEIHEFLTWFGMLITKVGMQNMDLDIDCQVLEQKEMIKKKFESIISELEDRREVAQSKDTLLQVERNKVEELTRKEEILQKSLYDKESRLNFLEGVDDSGAATSLTPEILEVEPMVNKWTVPGTSIAPQVRSLRKGNNDQVAIAVDTDPGSSSRLEDEEDDKVHGFKSLATSRIIPRFTRPVTEMIDGLWVSCDRTLMRRPALRLFIMIYWAVLHALLGALAF
ncbi:hypothetical protein FNV43_RR11682 [Rhamnella rubrinervis]|uniref:Uncharacterized protein n=1 Tax=Rhamnella rubrinervis TaxID=2594499 RepID=A0A8K0H6V5_9ROSA|nr:hypothetical protein FNV43_RR11682 [Rhamnella rubrinervis]